MRRRSLRSSILILLILVLSLVSLGFKNLHIAIPGFPILERGGTGPLGLKLGLDLQGGGHLVYQADTGTLIDVAFNREVRAEDINQVLSELGIRESEVAPQSPVSFRIKAAPLDDAALQKLCVALPEKLSSAAKPVTIASFQATQIPEPTPDQMEGAVEIINRRVNLFGTDDPIIQRFGDDRIIVQLPGAGGSVTQVQFRQPVNRQDLSSALQAGGLPSAMVEQKDERSFSIKSSTLSPAKRVELRQVLLLTVAGYSVNDTIVVFDRIRENLVRRTGWSLDSVVNLSIVETMGRSLNTSFTALFALLAMLLIGGSSIQVLLLTVALGVAIGTYSSVFIASQALVIWERGEVKKLLTRGRQFPALGGASLHHSKL